jgi:hypothetical protein
MQEHEQGRIDWLRKGIRITTRGPSITALEKLSCVPFVSFYKKTGSLDKPKIDLILKHSKPSPFGKGFETVMDETYHRGREIVADKIDLESEVAQVVNAMLFIPRRVQLKLHKLVVLV